MTAKSEAAPNSSNPFYIVLKLRSSLANEALRGLLADEGLVARNASAINPSSGVAITEVLHADKELYVVISPLNNGFADEGASRTLACPLKFSALVDALKNLRESRARKASQLLWLSPDTGQIHCRDGDQALALTEKESAILKLLLSRAPKSVAREEFLEQVWGYRADITTHTLGTHIYRLRQKIQQQGGDADWIVATNGGYKLAGATAEQKELDAGASFGGSL